LKLFLAKYELLSKLKLDNPRKDIQKEIVQII